jgi:hypothetical protein
LHKKGFLAVSLAVAALAVGLASAAWADPTSSHSGGANAVQIGNVKIDANNPAIAYVTGRYSCPSSTDPAHLFVSAKEMANGLPDRRLKEEGSSKYVDGGWLLRHPDPSEWTCDGTWHTGTWMITGDPSVPGFEYGGGILRPGTVYVQFCWDGPGDNPAWHAYSEQYAHASY